VETTGRRERRLALAGLRSIRLTPRGVGGRQAAWLTFARGRATLVSHSLAGFGVYEDRGESFGALVRAIAAGATAAGAPVRASSTAFNIHGSMIGIIGLLGLGALALLFFSLTSGTAGLGVTLAARLLFVLILIFAVTPWFDATPPKLDPSDLPRSLLP
jgi:hypothetical protein